MGFLDHSTNNIILDAVLTDRGRELLARNDGSFSIVKFALGDDEINYTNIKKFGRSVGAEKIIKNTPILEANTTGNLSIKYPLVIVANPILFRLPRVSLSGDGLSGTILSMKRSGQNSNRSVSITQTVQNENLIEPELQDQVYFVKAPVRFLTVNGLAPRFIDKNGVGTFVIVRSSTISAVGGSTATITLRTKAITDAQFASFGNGSIIKDVVTITGAQSGAASSFQVQITKT